MPYITWKNIWKVKVPFKVAFFTWTTACGLSTMENLQKWCICLIDWCCMCMHGETIGHLLLHCDCAWSVVYGVLSILGQWVKWRKWWSCWSARWAPALVTIILLIYGGPMPCAMWTIWRERNFWTFDVIKHSSMGLKLYLLWSMCCSFSTLSGVLGFVTLVEELLYT